MKSFSYRHDTCPTFIGIFTCQVALTEVRNYPVVPLLRNYEVRVHVLFIVMSLASQLERGTQKEFG